MNDLEHELRELLETKAHEPVVAPTPTPKLLKRARRRQVGIVFAAIAGTAALVVSSVVGLQTLIRTEPRPPGPANVPVLPDAPDGFRSVALPFASIAYPENWYLLETSPDHAPEAFQAFDVLQLTNWDPALRSFRCDVTGTRIPDHGVMLQVGSGNPDLEVPAWPVELRELPDHEKGSCSATTRSAAWSAPSGIEYAAVALAGPDASPADIAALERSFESLSFPPGSESQTEGFSGTPSLILDSANTPVGPLALYAYEEPCEGSSLWIGIAGAAGSGLSGASGCSSNGIPAADEDVTMNLGEWGGVVWGDVAASVARAELRTVDGATYPATLLSLPASLDAEGLQAVWGIVPEATDDAVTTLVYDENGTVLNGFYPTGPRVTIATGTDPEAGRWELFLQGWNEGTGLGYSFENGGGGSSCCLRPLEGAFRLAGSGGGGGDPGHVTGFASEAVSRVVFEPADGEPIEGLVFPIPDDSLGIPKVALVVVPANVALLGDLVAYDADGNELGREFVGDAGEPPGPTPEIDAIWRSLRTARDAASRYFEREGTFDTVTLDALIDLADPPQDVTFATRPEPQTVSVYVTDELHLVVSSATITGETYCIAIEADPPDGGFGYRYGAVFAQTYDDCRGGWPELEP